jgi:hypothetical protein
MSQACCVARPVADFRYSVAAGTAACAVAAFCVRLLAVFFVAFLAAFPGAFLAAFLAVGACWAIVAASASALTLAQRFLVASTIAFFDPHSQPAAPKPPPP